MRKVTVMLSLCTLLATTACSGVDLGREDTDIKSEASENNTSLPSEEIEDATGSNGEDQNAPEGTVGDTDEEQDASTGAEIENELLFSLEEHFFNQIETVDGLPTIQNPDNLLALVNKEFALPEDYKPIDLVIPDVKFSFEGENEKKYLRQEAAEALQALFEDALEQDIILYAVSGYRSYGRQTSIFNWEVQAKGEEEARRAVAFPGQSEHQTGLSMDISSASVNYDLTQRFGEMPEGQWVADNAHKHGFIIRYPEGKEEITGYKYEPWHLRYVGQELAAIIYEHELTLEEYFNKVKKI